MQTLNHADIADAQIYKSNLKFLQKNREGRWIQQDVITKEMKMKTKVLGIVGVSFYSLLNEVSLFLPFIPSPTRSLQNQ